MAVGRKWSLPLPNWRETVRKLLQALEQVNLTMASPPRGAGGVGGGGGGDVRITVRMLSGGARVYLLPEAAGQGAPVARLKALIKGDVGTCAEEQILVRALEASVRSARAPWCSSVSARGARRR